MKKRFALKDYLSVMNTLEDIERGDLKNPYEDLNVTDRLRYSFMKGAKLKLRDYYYQPVDATKLIGTEPVRIKLRDNLMKEFQFLLDYASDKEIKTDASPKYLSILNEKYTHSLAKHKRKAEKKLKKGKRIKKKNPSKKYQYIKDDINNTIPRKNPYTLS